MKDKHVVWLSSDIGSVTNMRSAPSLTSRIVGQLDSLGRLCTYIEDVGEWSRYEQSGSFFFVRKDVHQAITLDADGMKIPVPFVGQNTKEAMLSRNDCGPACSVMLIHHYTDHRPTVDEFTKSIGAHIGHPYTTIAQNMRGMRRYDLYTGFSNRMNMTQVLRHLHNGLPVMSLVNYAHLTNRRFPHFVVVTGYELKGDHLQIIVNDPLLSAETEYRADRFSNALSRLVRQMPNQGIFRQVIESGR